MLRRNFLRGSLALVGGLVVGDEALEMFVRLTHHRKSFPTAWPGQVIGSVVVEGSGPYSAEVSYQMAKVLRGWVRDQWGRDAPITDGLIRRLRWTEVIVCGDPGYSRLTVGLA